MADEVDKTPAVAEDVAEQVLSESEVPEILEEDTESASELNESTPEDTLNLGDTTAADGNDVDDEVDGVAEDDGIDTESSSNTDDTEEGESTGLVLDDGEDDMPSLDNLNEEVDEELEEKEDTIREIEYLVNDENFYQFSRQSCVAVGGGSYHCSVSEEPALDESTVVYADKGENGAMQIFLKTTKGGVKQITNDTVDNTSPHYSGESMEIVWQRMIDGRYQIVVYDIDTAKERQLTFSRTNNMEPKVSPDGIVWQAWDGNDWEVMYFDGTYTDQLTNNNSNDVAPVIEDRYVLWSVLGGDEQEARVYSLDSKQQLTITGHDGGEIVNPRFVLVYDTRFENGDVVTQGFDPETGITTPLGAKPAPEPIEIPLVDPLGEVRALINSKSQQEDDLQSALNPDTASNTNTLSLDNNVTSSSDTLSLKTLDTHDVDMSLPDLDDAEEFELTDYDLVVVPVELPPEEEEEPATTLELSEEDNTQE